MLGLGLLMTTYSHNTLGYSISSTNNDSLIKTTWNKFANSVLNRDRQLFKSISTDCIYCSKCVTNTQKKIVYLWYIEVKMKKHGLKTYIQNFVLFQLTNF